MNINNYSLLKNEKVTLYPLKKDDFETLYSVACDPVIWEQHPNKNRWQKEVFRTFFEGALQSQCAFIIVDQQTGNTIGSTRIYDHNEQEKTIFIGYTFFAYSYWGSGTNHLVKTMLLNHVFQFVSKVYFHIGANNIRSQIAIERLGAEKIEEQEVAYFGEASRLNYLYVIGIENWKKSLSGS